MAVEAHGRIVVGGSLGDADSWSCSFACSGGDFENNATMQTMAEGMEDMTHDWWTTGSPSINAVTADTAFLTYIKTYYYSEPGDVLTGQGEFLYSAPVNGGGSGKLSLRDAMVTTFITGTPGRSGKGRLYIPAAGAILVDHQFSTTDVNNVATATADWLTAFNAAGFIGGLAIASVSTKLGVLNITDVRVDSVPDSQRRRTNKLVAAHTDSVAVS